MATHRTGLVLATLGLGALMIGNTVSAGEADVRKELAELRKLIQQQAQRLEAQRQRINELEKKLQSRIAQDVKAIREELDKVAAKAEPGPMDLRAFWKEGLRFETADKDFSLKLGGRIMNDWIWANEDAEVRDILGEGLDDGTEFRRVRLYAAGKIYRNVDYKLQFDFAGGDAALKDAYLGFRGLPLGYLKVGHFKEPFGLEELTSSKYITFLERGLPNVFAPSRNTGVQLSNHHLEDRLTWAVGVFRNADSYGEGTSEGGYDVTARLTGLPIYANKGETLLHLGVAGSLRQTDAAGDTIRYRQRPEIHLSPRFVDTGTFFADGSNLLGAEAALVRGPFSLQGEYMWADVDGGGAGDPRFDGFYLQASYFLTGEHRRYKRSAGAFTRVKPKNNFGKGGWGAWEAALRYSSLDLQDQGITGGELDNWSLGLNWYLNPNTRFMFNYVKAGLDRDGSRGDADFFGVRAQIDF